MRILAIDHGEVRCGCAISDPSGTIARPLEVVAPDVEAVKRLVEAEGVGQVVVGLPLSLDGVEGGQAELARGFGDRLADALAVPVDFWDERLTTAMAGASRRAGAAAAEDSLAAAHLLESYLSAAQREREREGERS